MPSYFGCSKERIEICHNEVQEESHSQKEDVCLLRVAFLMPEIINEGGLSSVKAGTQIFSNKKIRRRTDRQRILCIEII